MALTTHHQLAIFLPLPPLARDSVTFSVPSYAGSKIYLRFRLVLMKIAVNINFLTFHSLNVYEERLYFTKLS